MAAADQLQQGGRGEVVEGVVGDIGQGEGKELERGQGLGLGVFSLLEVCG